MMFSVEMKNKLNERVIDDCPINGTEIVAERMIVSDWEITLQGTFIENFRGDSYDVQQRKVELQKKVKPFHRVKYFSAKRTD